MSQAMDQIKQLREETGVGIMDARKALIESQGNIQKAKEWINKNAVMKAQKKADRETTEGFIFSYVHQTGKVGAIVKLACETDFVALNSDFALLGKEISMQIASMDPQNVDALLSQTWIRDSGKTIKQLLNEYIGKLGENIKILEFVRMAL